MSNQFVPRGQWIFGASASYSTHTNKDYTFLVIEDINSDGYTFKVTPLIAYATGTTWLSASHSSIPAHCSA